MVCRRSGTARRAVTVARVENIMIHVLSVVIILIKKYNLYMMSMTHHIFYIYINVYIFMFKNREMMLNLNIFTIHTSWCPRGHGRGHRY